MQITALSKILKARRMAQQAYIVVFADDSGVSYELFIPTAGYPEFAGFMSPSLRNQSTGQSWTVDWPQAELIAAHLETVLETAGSEMAVASEVIDALTVGRRYGYEV